MPGRYFYEAYYWPTMEVELEETEGLSRKWIEHYLVYLRTSSNLFLDVMGLHGSNFCVCMKVYAYLYVYLYVFCLLQLCDIICVSAD